MVVDRLTPSPVSSEKEKRRVHGDKVLYATEHFQEALVHAISKANHWKNHASYSNADDRWVVRIPVEDNEIDRNSKIVVYELPSEGFRFDKDLGEWYSNSSVTPLKGRSLTVGEALNYFDEIKYGVDRELAGGGEKWI